MLTTCLLATALIAVGASAAPPRDPMAKVRPDGEKAAALLSNAVDASASVRRLVAELEASDLIVLVSVRPPTPDESRRSFRGSLRLAGVGHGQRFASVWVDEWAGARERVGLLAHELQHAVELANAPWVTTQDQVRERFGAIGREHCRDRFETEAAIDAELAARQEAASFLARAGRVRRSWHG
jgi:hypothetical protein